MPVINFCQTYDNSICKAPNGSLDKEKLQFILTKTLVWIDLNWSKQSLKVIG